MLDSGWRGAAQRAGGGCACPESVLLKSLVRHLVLKCNEVVILDMEAGIEHLGRGTALGVDLLLVVVEPGQRSVDTAHRIQEMAAGLGIRSVSRRQIHLPSSARSATGRTVGYPTGRISRPPTLWKMTCQ